MEAAAFYGFSTLAIVAALFILFSKNLIYAAFALFLTFLGVAALFVLAGADFLGVSQIMIYVGGILVLLIFGIMLTQRAIKDDSPSRHNRVDVPVSRKVWGGLIGFGIVMIFTRIIFSANFRMSGEAVSRKSTIKTIGVELMTTHLLPFEIAAVLLLVALVGAAYLALNRNPAK
ncbi:NADH-quinone oxidoreductase subunit J family protein [Dyadobacter aurulentus]|uniref:NADH-quinone oxidoreductase subunit J family protein n=1 Tax=Dyadobacter sp. UC 10 TaxID=2605428 RepID=UPI0011F28970|nr:NADH-quinone oxidoreductase subunit J [Dyadobacter sp. UC 10]